MVISSANTHDIKLVIDVIDNIVIRRPSLSSPTSRLRRRRLHHLCLDKAYNSKPVVEHELIRIEYVLNIRYKRKRSEDVNAETQQIKNNKKYPARRWVVERTNSSHNRFRKLFTRYEKKVEENYLGLVQFSCCIIIYRKIILG